LERELVDLNFDWVIRSYGGLWDGNLKETILEGCGDALYVEFLGYLKGALNLRWKCVGRIIPFPHKAKGALLEGQGNVLLAKSREVGLKNPGSVGLNDPDSVRGVIAVRIPGRGL
tara:strand:- start:124 stop:468 length:345 start_codon:yes stop_codon:yes gene_type:complete